MTHDDRIDTIIQTDKPIYIFELKVNKTEQEALDQIEHKKYYESYKVYQKSITLAGLSFSTKDEDLNVTYVAKDMF